MNELSEISALVKEYISPETVWLVPCLYALGSIIKRSIRIDDTLIPGILCLVGVLLSALVSVAACEPVGWMQWVILAAVSASLAPEENFSQDDPPVFGQRVVENSGVLKTVG